MLKHIIVFCFNFKTFKDHLNFFSYLQHAEETLINFHTWKISSTKGKNFIGSNERIHNLQCFQITLFMMSIRLICI